MSRYWLIALAAGVASALVTALAGVGSFGALVLAYFAQLPLFLVALSMGAGAGAIAGVAAAIAMVPLGGVVAALIFAALNAAPVALLTRQALLSRTAGDGNVEWYPLGRLVMCLTGGAAVLLTVASAYLALQPGGMEGAVRSAIDSFVEAALSELPAERQQEISRTLVALLPGVVAASWMLSLVANGALAQGLLVRFQRNLRPSGEFAAMTYPPAFPLFAAAAALVGLLPGMLGYYGTNLTEVFIVPFFLLGLAVVHSLCRRSAAGPFLLGLFYALMILLAWLILVVAVLGIVEQLAQLRRRIA